MPDRTLRTGIRESDAINSLSWQAESFFYRLLVSVDDFARFYASPPLLLAALFPLRVESITLKEIEDWRNECQNAKLLFTYTYEGKTYLQINKFKQRVRAEKSKFPDPKDGALSDKCPTPVSPPPTTTITNTNTTRVSFNPDELVNRALKPNERSKEEFVVMCRRVGIDLDRATNQWEYLQRVRWKPKGKPIRDLKRYVNAIAKNQRRDFCAQEVKP